MVKKVKPGQFASINGCVCRARKRIKGCKGCIFNNFFSCLYITKNSRCGNVNECELNGVIYTKI